MTLQDRNPNIAALRTLTRAEAARLEARLDDLRDAGAARSGAPAERLALYNGLAEELRALTDTVSALDRLGA